MTAFALAVLIIAIALIFDFINGFHDAANSIATVVATRVLTPFQAVVWAAFFNFIAAFGFGTAVASAVGKGFVDLDLVTPYVILAGLIGAIAWDLITWWLGLPTSSSHALIGGYAGAAMARVAGQKGIRYSLDALVVGKWPPTLTFIVLAPLIGLVVAYILMIAVYWAFRNSTPSKMDMYFRKLQLVSAAAFSLAHGTNDAHVFSAVLDARCASGALRVPDVVTLVTGSITTCKHHEAHRIDGRFPGDSLPSARLTTPVQPWVSTVFGTRSRVGSRSAGYPVGTISPCRYSPASGNSG
jgi:phosphate/sulfate permease